MMRGTVSEPVQSLAAVAVSAPVLLQKQEQIQGPENASIARFDGLCCYQTSSESSDGFGAGDGSETAFRAGVRRVLNTGAGLIRVRCGFSGFSGFGTDSGAQRPLSEPGPPGFAARKAFKSRERAKAALNRSPVQGPVLLRFQERIQGPQNASIARFHGLRCYQTSSEAGDDFCALRRQKSCGWPGCKRALRNCQAANEKARKHASWRAEAAHEPATGCKAKVASWT